MLFQPTSAISQYRLSNNDNTISLDVSNLGNGFHIITYKGVPLEGIETSSGAEVYRRAEQLIQKAERKANGQVNFASAKKTVARKSSTS